MMQMANKIQTVDLPSKGPVCDHQLVKEVEDTIIKNELTVRMMNWIPWTQALIPMLHVVAGLWVLKEYSHVLQTLQQRYFTSRFSVNSGVYAFLFSFCSDWLQQLCTRQNGYYWNSMNWNSENQWFMFQGPLFQQRPYPSPGAVLRKNAEVASQRKKPSSQFTAITKRGDGSDGLGDAD